MSVLFPFELYVLMSLNLARRFLKQTFAELARFSFLRFHKMIQLISLEPPVLGIIHHKPVVGGGVEPPVVRHTITTWP